MKARIEEVVIIDRDYDREFLEALPDIIVDDQGNTVSYLSFEWIPSNVTYTQFIIRSTSSCWTASQVKQLVEDMHLKWDKVQDYAHKREMYFSVSNGEVFLESHDGKRDERFLFDGIEKKMEVCQCCSAQ